MKPFVFFVACSLFTACFAQTPAPPQADAEFLEVLHEYTLQKDGGWSYRYEHRLAYLTYFAVNRAYGETFIVYDPEWQKLTVTSAETYLPDGSVVRTPPNAFNEVTPQFAAQSGQYRRLREMVVTHIALQRGCTVRLAYRLDTKPGFLPGLSGRVICGGRSPVRRLIVRVIVPSGTPLHHVFFRSSSEPVRTAEGGNDVYTWELAGIPMVAVESHQPGYERIVPVLHFSTYDYAAMRKHVLPGKGFLVLPDRAVKAVSEIVKNERSNLERAMALRKWVETDFALVACDPAVIGFKALPPARVFEDAVGTGLDKASFLAAACLEAGLDAEPALLSADQPIPSLSMFGRAAVLVHTPDSGDFLLDPNSPQDSPLASGLSGVFPFPLCSFAEPTRYAGPEVENKVSLVCDWVVSPDWSIKGRCRAEQNGAFAVPFDPRKAADRLARSCSVAAWGMKVSEAKGERTGVIRTVAEAAVNSDPYRETTAGLMAIKLPAVPFGIEESPINVGPRERTTAVSLPAAMREELRMTIHFPKGIAPVALPGETRIRNGVGEVRSLFRYDGDIELTRTLVLFLHEVPPERYPELQALLRVWHDPAQWTIRFDVSKKTR
ncbi:MAG: DUF3857 domain-containing protein [Bacteroidota bacterium]|nr:DUF3857 domain-containing protein [Bacteroidota bacterium]